MTLNHHSIDMTTMRESFVDSTPPINQVDRRECIGCIYVITNIQSGKVYIGQTKNFERRVSDYLRYGCGDSAKYSSRVSKMYRILRDEGIENFKIRRYYDCATYTELNEKEVELILEFKSILPELGYNSTINVFPMHEVSTVTTKRRSESHICKSQNASTLRKRGHECIALNPDEMRVYICDSMKLFGELVLDKTKDVIRAAAIRGNRIGGFFIFTESTISRVIDDGIDSWCNSSEYRKFCTYIRTSDIPKLKADGYRVFEIRYSDEKTGIKKL